MKPILFSTPMVQAILDGRKTQTRRVVSRWQDLLNDRSGYDCQIHEHNYRLFLDNDGFVCTSCGWGVEPLTGNTPIKPRYYSGDILWVRETWAHIYADTTVCGSTYPIENRYIYKADVGTEIPERWKPSIHMPREAARLFLRVTDVRVERLQEITYEDAHAEGIDVAGASYQTYYKGQFKDLWDSLNAKRGYGWDTNPWVWVYTFERCDKPQ